jgi:hypothetical protein
VTAVLIERADGAHGLGMLMPARIIVPLRNYAAVTFANGEVTATYSGAHKMADGIVDNHQLRRQRLLNMTEERGSKFLIGT